MTSAGLRQAYHRIQRVRDAVGPVLVSTEAWTTTIIIIIIIIRIVVASGAQVRRERERVRRIRR